MPYGLLPAEWSRPGFSWGLHLRKDSPTEAITWLASLEAEKTGGGGAPALVDGRPSHSALQVQRRPAQDSGASKRLNRHEFRI